VYSADLPGLILSGSDREVVAAKIVPAIRALFEYHGIRDVKITATKPINEVLEGASPRNMDLHIDMNPPLRQVFVVEIPELQAA
jgi:hypothetical protein